ncbi:MAG: hypothetical protein M1820_006580 [Bogoriella megaspora]|nr:MAG: hypothetical protein M1820_006580 [Bogoriella megaspora]
MTRRIVRTGIQIGVFASILLLLAYLLDNRYSVLPTSIHNQFPAHHPGLIVTDIQVKFCSSLNPLSSCAPDSEHWQVIDKELYLGTVWFSRAYAYVMRMKEEELGQGDKVVLDVRISRLDPGISEKSQSTVKWESRNAGLWLKRSARHADSDSKQAVTAVDLLFGADAVEPRTGWEIKDPPLLLNTAGETQEARLTMRRGQPSEHEKVVPRVRKDGKFKIMQAADLHLSTGFGHCRDTEPDGKNGNRCDADTRTLEFVGRLLDDEKPDLVVLSGDQVNGETAPDAQSAIFKFAELFIQRKIPYAAIFGNHDDEGSLPRSAQMELLQTLPYSLSNPGPNTIDGVGNYVVEVLARGNSQHSAFTLYLLDTHSYSPDEGNFAGYDWIKPNQIQWFKDTAKALKKEHSKYSMIHLSMAFIHIPIPEYTDPSAMRVGQYREPPTAPMFNSGFRDALVEEGVVFVSCGHDHVNDYCALSQSSETHRPELWMCYAGGSGYGGYGGWGGYDRRLRFFELDTNEARITTWKRVDGPNEQAKKTQLDRQIIVEAGKVIGE